MVFNKEIKMRVHGTQAPEGAYNTGLCPKRIGYVCVRFYENASQTGENAWEWDEYHLELPEYGGLDDDIVANLSVYKAEAKAIEDDARRAENTEEVADMAYVNSELALALIELIEIGE